MKIIFEYTFEKNCYGDILIKNNHTVTSELKSVMDVELPPCDKPVKVSTNDFRTAEVEFWYRPKFTVGKEKVPFKYNEHHESFGDSLSYNIYGTIQLSEE